MRAEIKKLQARLSVTAIYVTHDQVEAMTMGHRIAVLHAGMLQQVGAPLELYERPANLFVAAFIGTPPMNFVQATLGGRRPAPDPARASRCRCRPRAPGGAGRPRRRQRGGGRAPRERRRRRARQPRGETAPLSVTVEIVEPLGNEVVVHARPARTP